MSPNDKTSSGSGAVDVGVIVPCYNNASTVLEAIQSITQQSYKHIIIAIVNDGSTDSSEEIIRQLFTDVKTDKLDDDETFTIGMIGNIPAILISHLKHEGMPISKNKGVLAMWRNVKYFTVLEANSVMTSDKLERCVAVAEADKYIGIVYHDVLAYNEEDNVLYKEITTPYNREILEDGPEYVVPGALISKAALEAAGGYEHTLPAYEDWDLWLRITERMLAIHIADTLGQYTVKPVPVNQDAIQTILSRMAVRKG